MSALVAGLVLILLLIGFTVTQYAFRSLRAALRRRADASCSCASLAVDGAGAAVWEWNARRDEIKVGPIIEAALGLSAGRAVDQGRRVHQAPASGRPRAVPADAVVDAGAAGGKIRTDFRMRHADNSYRWFEIEAASVPQRR